LGYSERFINAGNRFIAAMEVMSEADNIIGEYGFDKLLREQSYS
jgi:hypothetical protein